MCRTESVVHNTTMAVLMEGIVADPEGIPHDSGVQRLRFARATLVFELKLGAP